MKELPEELLQEMTKALVDELLDALFVRIGGGAERSVDIRALVVQVQPANDAALFEDGVGLGVGRATFSFEADQRGLTCPRPMMVHL